MAPFLLPFILLARADLSASVLHICHGVTDSTGRGSASGNFQIELGAPEPRPPIRSSVMRSSVKARRQNKKGQICIR